MRKTVIGTAILFLGLTPAFAATSCEEQATTKKLAGAARTSFMTKCEKDATASCEKAASEKKLAGAAKSSFQTKCLSDAVGRK